MTQPSGYFKCFVRKVPAPRIIVACGCKAVLGRSRPSGFWYFCSPSAPEGTNPQQTDRRNSIEIDPELRISLVRTTKSLTQGSCTRSNMAQNKSPLLLPTFCSREAAKTQAVAALDGEVGCWAATQWAAHVFVPLLVVNSKSLLMGTVLLHNKSFGEAWLKWSFRVKYKGRLSSLAGFGSRGWHLPVMCSAALGEDLKFLGKAPHTAHHSDLAGLEGTAASTLGFLIFTYFGWSWCLSKMYHKFWAFLFSRAGCLSCKIF